MRGKYTGMTDIDGLIIIDGAADSVGKYAFAQCTESCNRRKDCRKRGVLQLQKPRRSGFFR